MVIRMDRLWMIVRHVAMGLLILLGMVACSSQVKARRTVSYRFESGRTALMKNGIAYAPRHAPAAVKRALAGAVVMHSTAIPATIAPARFRMCCGRPGS